MSAADYCTPTTINSTYTQDGNWFNFTFTNYECEFCVDTGVEVVCTNNCVVAPVASFTVNATCGVETLPVLFTDTSTGGVTYYWDFGDGNTSTTQSPEYQYVFPGRFSVSHSATNPVGTSWDNQTDLITVAVNGTFCTGGGPGGNCTPSGNFTQYFNQSDLIHYNSSTIIANQPVQMTTELIWIVFALLGIAMLLMSAMDFNYVVKDLTSIFATLFLFISTIQAFSVNTVTGYGVTNLDVNGIRTFVLMENHTIYHYDFIGVALGICFIIAIANQYRLWLEWRRVKEVSSDEEEEMREN